MGKVFLTADCHFGHKNLIKATSEWDDKSLCRDFASVEEHDQYLIDITNRHVKPKDTLYHLGDFAMGKNARQRIPLIREQIHCENIHLIRGNHDSLFRSKTKEKFKELFDLFKSVNDLVIKEIYGHFFFMCHYPSLSWYRKSHGCIMAHGHCHATLTYPFVGNILDAGRDACYNGHERYAPFEASELIEVLKKRGSL